MESWQELIKGLEEEFRVREANLELREAELALLHEIDKRILSHSIGLADTFSYIVQEVARLFQADYVDILLKRGARLEVVQATLSDAHKQLVPIESSCAGASLQRKHPVLIKDLFDPGSTNGIQYVQIRGWEGPPMRSLLAAPIWLDAEPIGALTCESAQPSNFTSSHSRALENIAGQVAVALEHAQLFDRDALFASVDKLLFADDPTQVIVQRVLEAVMASLLSLKFVDIARAQILFHNPIGNRLYIAYSTNPTDVGASVSVHESVSGRAFITKCPVVVDDVVNDPDYRRLLGEDIRSEIAVPIVMGAGDAVLGVLNVESPEPGLFAGFYEPLMVNFARRVATVLALAKLRGDVADALELRHADNLLVAVGDQTTNMIHRLNNRVGAMRYRIQELQVVVENGTLDNEFLNESLATLLTQAEETLDLPQKLKRLLAGRDDSTDVNRCIVAAVDELLPPATVHVHLDLDPDLPRLNLFSFDLVVQNLIRNALDAMPAGGDLAIATRAVNPEKNAGAVEVKTRGYVEMTVRDSGHGMTKDVMEHIFDLNFTTKAERENKGLGLGLWWVKTFVDRAGGNIDIESHLGVGTVFAVRLPVDRG